LKKIKNATFIKLFIIVVLVMIYVFVQPVRTNLKKIIFIFNMLDVEAIKGYILSYGVWAPVVSFFLMIFQSIAAPLPAFLITFANAALFGWIKGALLSWVSAMVGSTVCYYIAKIYGKKTVEKLTSKYALEEIDKFFEKYGKYAILIARLLPFVSFDIVSYGAGLTSMSLGSFLIATGIGQIPATLIYSYVGGMLVGSVKTFVFGLLIVFSLSVFGFLMKKIFDEKKKITSEKYKLEDEKKKKRVG
jgi:uncharacterized membrane protein YdjX (TVP38/TMEM64 family)